MPWTRFRRRHARHTSHRHVFGKKAVRAIKAIAAKPQETKWSLVTDDVTEDWPVSSWVPNGANNSSIAFVRNIFWDVNSSDSLGVPSRSEVEGQFFNSRGISVKFLLHYPTNDLVHILRWRVTVFSTTEYPTTWTDTWQPVNSTDTLIWNPDDSSPDATFRRFNHDKMNVLKSMSGTLSLGGQQNSLVEKKMWIPLRRKMVVREREATNTTLSNIGWLKDKNYFIVLEMYDPQGLLLTSETYPYWKTEFRKQVYWKDP